jgi:hypothetical protein
LNQLTGDLAIQLREQFHRITLCVRAGSHGRLTPLVIDPPSNQQAMEIIVLTTMSPGELCIIFSSLCSTRLLSHDRC